MPMITLPLVPAMVALIALIACFIEDEEYATPQVILGLFVAAISYFAVYGLTKAVGMW